MLHSGKWYSHDLVTMRRHSYVLMKNGTHMPGNMLMKSVTIFTHAGTNVSMGNWGTDVNIPLWEIENVCPDSNWHQNTIQGVTVRKNI